MEYGLPRDGHFEGYMRFCTVGSTVQPGMARGRQIFRSSQESDDAPSMSTVTPQGRYGLYHGGGVVTGGFCPAIAGKVSDQHKERAEQSTQSIFA